MINFITDYKNRYFIRLWWAQLISQFGNRLNQMALIGLIAEQTKSSAMDLAILLAFTIIPVFIVSPIAGVYVDRWNHRQTLFVCDIVRSFLVVCICLTRLMTDSMLPIYVLVFLIFCFSRFHVPAKMSIIPDLVPKEHLLTANSLITTTGMIAFVLGCSAGGLLVDRVGAQGGFIGDAITFFLSGLLIMSIKKDFNLQLDRKKILSKGKEFIRIEKSVIAEIKEGLQYLTSKKEIRFVINMLFILLAAAGAIYVVIIIFIQQAFHSVTKDLGVLAVFLGIGLFLGVLGYGRVGKQVVWYKTIFYCLILGGLMINIFALVVDRNPNLILAASLALILGLVVGPIFIASNTIVHLVSNESMRGKVFTALEIVIHFSFLVAMLISSWLINYVPPVRILVAVGILFALIGLLGLIRYRDGGDLVIEEKKI